MSHAWFGIVEVVIGILGLVLGAFNRSNRLTMVIAAGLLLMGVAHFLHGLALTYVTDIGAVILLVGLVIMVIFLRRSRKGGGS